MGYLAAISLFVLWLFLEDMLLKFQSRLIRGVTWLIVGLGTFAIGFAIGF